MPITLRPGAEVAAAGGAYREVVFEACGHSPHIEHPDRFAAVPAEAVGAVTR